MERKTKLSELQSGQVVELTVLEEQGSKWILTDGHVEIPLNSSDILTPLVAGERVKVFLYADRRGNLQATTAIPAILQGDYGWARVIKVTKEGAFVDIGSSREVLVKEEDLPPLESVWPEVGDHLYLTLRTDRNGDLFGRLVTEEKVNEIYEGAYEEMHNKNIKARPYRLLPVGAFLLGTEEPYQFLFIIPKWKLSQDLVKK